MQQELGVLCGGSGSSKFAKGFASYCDSVSSTRIPSFIANVSDNFWHENVFICPDIDILMYALSGELDVAKGWGLANDTTKMLDRLSKFDSEGAWFSLGDMDLALSLRRTFLLKNGWRLSTVLQDFCKRLGVRWNVIPATDDYLETYFKTNRGLLHLQEFWVKLRARLFVYEVIYLGQKKARISNILLKLLERGPRAIIACPANPITSIMPTLSLPGMKKKISNTHLVAISPFIENKPFSGPAGTIMKSLGLEPNSFGVARLYFDYHLTVMILDLQEDHTVLENVKDLGVECIRMNTCVPSVREQRIFAKELLEMI